MALSCVQRPQSSLRGPHTSGLRAESHVVDECVPVVDVGTEVCGCALFFFSLWLPVLSVRLQACCLRHLCMHLRAHACATSAYTCVRVPLP